MLPAASARHSVCRYGCSGWHRVAAAASSAAGQALWDSAQQRSISSSSAATSASKASRSVGSMYGAGSASYAAANTERAVGVMLSGMNHEQERDMYQRVSTKLTRSRVNVRPYEAAAAPYARSAAWSVASTSQVVNSNVPSFRQNGVVQKLWEVVSAVRSGRSPPGRLHTALGYWRQLQLSGRPVGKTTLSSVIVCYQLLSMPNIAIQLYQMEPPERLTAFAYEALMECALSTGDVDFQLEIMDAYEKAVRPLSRTQYELLFVTCVRAHDTRRADVVLQSLQELPGDLSPRVYQELAAAAVRDKNPARAAEFMQYLFQHPEFPVPAPAKVTSLCEQVVLSALRCLDAEAAHTGINLLRTGKTWVDEGTLIATLNVAARRGHVQLAESLIAMAAEANLEFTAEHYNPVVQTYAASGDLLTAFRILSEVTNQGMQLDAGVQEAVIQACVNHGTEHLRLLLRSLHELNMTMTTEAVHLLLAALARVGAAQDAYALLMEARDEFVIPVDSKCFALVIDACTFTLFFRYKLAMRIMAEARSSELEMTSDLYEVLIKLLVRNGEPNKAQELLRRTRVGGKPLSPDTYERVARAHARRGSEKALEVLEDAKEAGVQMRRKGVEQVKKLLASGGLSFTGMRTGLDGGEDADFDEHGNELIDGETAEQRAARERKIKKKKATGKALAALARKKIAKEEKAAVRKAERQAARAAKAAAKAAKAAAN